MKPASITLLVFLALIFSANFPLNAQDIRPLTPSLEEFLIDDGDLGVNRPPPDIAVINDQSGDFVVVWSSHFPEESIYFKRFDLFGNPIDQNERSLLDSSGEITADASVSVDGLGNGGFLVVWNDLRPSAGRIYSPDVYGQYVNSDGEIEGVNVRLDGGVDSGTEGPEIAIYDQGNGTGIGMLSWVARGGGAGQDDVYGRAFDFWIDPIPPDPWFKSFITNGERLDSSTDGNFDGAQDITVDRNGLFTVVWHRVQTYGAPDSIKFSTFFEDDYEIEEGTFYSDDDLTISFPAIGTYFASLPDTAYVVTWEFDGIKAAVFDSAGTNIDDEGGIIDVFSGTIPAITAPRVATFKRNDDFIITWHAGSYFSDADIKAAAYDKSGTESLYNGTFDVGTSSGGNIHLKIDTYKDRVYVTWRKEEGGEENIYGSILTVDTSDPTISDLSDNLDPDAIIYDGNSNYVTTVNTTVEDIGARINTGLESVYLGYEIKGPWGSITVDSVAMGPPVQQNPPLPPSSYFGDLPMPDHPGSEIQYFIRAWDAAYNVERNPQDPDDFHGPIYVRELGDLNGNGCHTNVDLAIMYDIIAGEEATDVDSFFANIDQDPDGLINEVDVELLEDLIGEFPYILCSVWAPIGPPLEIAATHGGPGENNVPLPVYLDNDSSEVSTVYLEFQYDSTVFTIPTLEQTNRSQGIPYYFESQPNRKKLRLLGNDSTFIDPGEGEILNLKVNVASDAPEGSYHFNILRAAATDTTDKDLLVQPLRGKFFIPEPPPVSLICTPLSDTTISLGDSLRFNTTVTNHSDSTMSPKFFIYGTTTGPDSFTFLAVDTTQIMMLPPGGKKRDITDLEVPTNAPLGHYIFTAYIVSPVTDSTFDDDSFEFQVNGQSRPGYGGNELASSSKDMGPWKILQGWFGYNERKGGESEGTISSSPLPKTFSISQNYPNPFNPSTTIQFDVSGGHPFVPVSITIYDLRGRLVRALVDEKKEPGTYRIQWDGRDEMGTKVSSGVYLYIITAGDYVSTRKMVMVK